MDYTIVSKTTIYSILLIMKWVFHFSFFKALLWWKHAGFVRAHLCIGWGGHVIIIFDSTYALYYFLSASVCWAIFEFQNEPNLMVVFGLFKVFLKPNYKYLLTSFTSMFLKKTEL